MNELEKMLGDQIKTEIEGLAELKPGSDEKSKAVEDLAKLYRLKIDEMKANLDYLDRRQRRILEGKNHRADEALKQQQLDNEKKSNEIGRKSEERDRYVKIGIAAAELVLPLMFYAFWMRKGLEFEKDGTFTSTTFRGLFNKFKPTK